jgi:hypothetical protein
VIALLRAAVIVQKEAQYQEAAAHLQQTHGHEVHHEGLSSSLECPVSKLVHSDKRPRPTILA